MRRTLGLITIAATLAGAGGCVTSEYFASGEAAYPARATHAPITVYVPPDLPPEIRAALGDVLTRADLSTHAHEIGRIDGVGSPAAGWGALLEDAKTKARRIGGDAISIVAWGRPVTDVDGRPTVGRSLLTTVLRDAALESPP